MSLSAQVHFCHQHYSLVKNKTSKVHLKSENFHFKSTTYDYITKIETLGEGGKYHEDIRIYKIRLE